MKKHIDKLCLHCNNIITLIKYFIKHKTKQHEREETIMLQQVMTNPGEIIFTYSSFSFSPAGPERKSQYAHFFTQNGI